MTNDLVSSAVILSDYPTWEWVALLLLPGLLLVTCVYGFLHGSVRRRLRGSADPFPWVLRTTVLAGGTAATSLFLIHMGRTCMEFAQSPFDAAGFAGLVGPSLIVFAVNVLILGIGLLCSTILAHGQQRAK